MSERGKDDLGEWLERIVEDLASRAGLTPPKLTVAPTKYFPAFVAWESDGPRVVIDSRITEVVGIRPDELREHAEVLLAHELGEIALGHGAPPDSDDEAREREFACDAFAARLLSCERVIQTLSITRLVGRSTGRGGHPTNEERIEQLAELWKGPRK